MGSKEKKKEEERNKLLLNVYDLKCHIYEFIGVVKKIFIIYK